MSPEAGVHYPVCLKGKGACPPEDVGGVWGYAGFLEAISDPNNSEHDEYLEWVGGEFDPDEFDLQEVNEQLRQIGRGRSAQAQNTWSVEQGEPTEKKFAQAASWSQTLPDDQQAVAENLPLRSDTITLLTYLRDNKVTGTTSTGNLPLKAAHEICARFDNPPILEEVIGEYVFKIRSESDVWPLYFRHLLASVLGLVAGGPGRRWRLTPFGERFLGAPAPLQVWLLSATWWTQINWAVASPLGYEDGFMPDGFSRLVLKQLLDLPEGQPEAFEPFADRIIEEARLSWPVYDQESGRRTLRVIIENIVIDPLINFGVLQAEYETHKRLGEGFRELGEFQLTSFGKGLLRSMEQILS